MTIEYTTYDLTSSEVESLKARILDHGFSYTSNVNSVTIVLPDNTSALDILNLGVSIGYSQIYCNMY